MRNQYVAEVKFNVSVVDEDSVRSVGKHGVYGRKDEGEIGQELTPNCSKDS